MEGEITSSLAVKKAKVVVELEDFDKTVSDYDDEERTTSDGGDGGEDVAANIVIVTDKGAGKKKGKEVGKKREFSLITILGYEWVSGEVASAISHIDTPDSVRAYLAGVTLTSGEEDEILNVEPCGENDQVFLAATPDQDNFIYFYLATPPQQLGILEIFSNYLPISRYRTNSQ